MIKAIVTFAIKQRLAVLIFMAFLIGVGVWRASQLPIDAEPDVTNTQVTVSALDPALGPQELEQRVTFPMEQALAGMYHLDHVESVSQYGLSQVVCYFDEQVDIYTARQYVAERIQTMQGQLPDGITPTMLPDSTGLGEVLHVVLVGGSMTQMERRTYMDWTFTPQIKQVPGIADVNVLGGDVRQYQVIVDEQALAARELTVADVDSALTQNNANVGGSFINQGPTERIIRGVGFIQTLDDIKRIVVTAKSGVPITLAQVAQVQEGAAPSQQAATQDGQGTFVVGIPLLRVHADTRQVVKDLKAKIAELQKGLPPDAHLVIEFDRTQLIQDTLNTAIHNLVEGGVLVVVILFLFLLQMRAGLIVSAIIPLSMVFAIMGMSTFHVSANLMSLGAIDFGMIVDGAVIIVENSVRRLSDENGDKKDGDQEEKDKKSGKNGGVSDDRRHEIIRDAAVEVLTPSVFGIIIILATYAPIMSLSSIEGKLFRPMGLTVMFALFGSLLLSLTLIPALCAFALRSKTPKRNKPLEKVTEYYKHGLGWALDHRWVTIGGALAFVALTVFLATRLGSQFIPELEENNIAVSVFYDPSTDLPEMVDRQTLMERVLMQSYPHEIAHVLSRIGRPLIPTDAMLQNQADVFLELKPRNEWKAAKDQKELTSKITKTLDALPGFSTEYTQPMKMRMDEMIYGQGQTGDIDIKVFGPDLDVLRQQALDIAGKVQSVKGASDVKVQTAYGLPQLVVALDRTKIARYGINIADVNKVIDSAIGDRTATTVSDGNEQIDVTVRLAPQYRSDPTSIGRVLVPGPNGMQVPLSSVADIQSVDGPIEIDRENERRRIVIEVNARGSDLGSVVQGVKQKIKTDVHLPPGYSIEYGGQYESLQSGRQRLTVVIPIALAAILALLLVVFGRLRQALIIFSGIPLAVSGGILALLIRGMQLSMTTAIGFISLGGIALLNGIVMLSFINDLRRQGKSKTDAVKEGAVERLRPVLMTGSVALFGFVPMALSTGTGGEVQRPLATVVIGGLITSTLLTLFVIPTLYHWLEKDEKEPHKAETDDKAQDTGPDRSQDDDEHGRDDHNSPTPPSKDSEDIFSYRSET